MADLKSEFQIGDVVKVKSGSPKMVISAFHKTEPKAECSMFIENGVQPFIATLMIDLVLLKKENGEQMQVY